MHKGRGGLGLSPPAVIEQTALIFFVSYHALFFRTHTNTHTITIK